MRFVLEPDKGTRRVGREGFGNQAERNRDNNSAPRNRKE